MAARFTLPDLSDPNVERYVSARDFLDFAGRNLTLTEYSRLIETGRFIVSTLDDSHSACGFEPERGAMHLNSMRAVQRKLFQYEETRTPAGPSYVSEDVRNIWTDWVRAKRLRDPGI